MFVATDLCLLGCIARKPSTIRDFMTYGEFEATLRRVWGADFLMFISARFIQVVMFSLHDGFSANDLCDQYLSYRLYVAL